MIGMGRPVFVDGGLATELEAAGHDLSDQLWSARLLLSEPDAIEAVHLAYYRAGAHVATTASYQPSIRGSAAAGVDRVTALEAIRRSVALAQRARDRFAAEAGRSIDGLLVAGSGGACGGGPAERAWRARSCGTGRCSRTARSTPATTTRGMPPCATSMRRVSRPSSKPAST